MYLKELRFPLAPDSVEGFLVLVSLLDDIFHYVFQK